MTGPRLVSQADVDELLAGAVSCSDCTRIGATAAAAGDWKPGAAAIDDVGIFHACDVVTGRTACGLDGNRWAWLIATDHLAGSSQLER